MLRGKSKTMEMILKIWCWMSNEVFEMRVRGGYLSWWKLCVIRIYWYTGRYTYTLQPPNSNHSIKHSIRGWLNRHDDNRNAHLSLFKCTVQSMYTLWYFVHLMILHLWMDGDWRLRLMKYLLGMIESFNNKWRHLTSRLFTRRLWG